MLLPALLLFLLFVLISAFFSSSETAFISSNPYTLEYLEKKGSTKAGAVRKTLARIDHLLTAILIGNTLANVAAASVATYILVALLPNQKQAVLLATVATTIFLLFFSEINPKIYAAYNPVKLSFLYIYPLKFFLVIFYPLVKMFTFLSSLMFRSSREERQALSRAMTEDETKVLLTKGIKGMSAFRKKMIEEIMDLAARPVKEIMTPRPQVKAIEISASQEQILETIQHEGFSRYPVYRGRFDQIEGLIHAKDIIPYLIDNKAISLSSVLRKPLFVPESAPVEKVLLQMKESAAHLAFVVDEFGSMEGIVTFEDVIEEIVGEIQDEHDDKEEAWFQTVKDNVFIIKGTASIKAINERLALKLPELREYTTLAGFFLYEFGRIPHEKDVLDFTGHRFIVEKMSKRHISLIRVMAKPGE